MRVVCKIFYHDNNTTFTCQVSFVPLFRSISFCFVIISDQWKKKILVTLKVQSWKLKSYLQISADIFVLYPGNFRKICYFHGKLFHFSIISNPFFVYTAHYGKRQLGNYIASKFHMESHRQKYIGDFSYKQKLRILKALTNLN